MTCERLSEEIFGDSSYKCSINIFELHEINVRNFSKYPKARKYFRWLRDNGYHFNLPDGAE